MQSWIMASMQNLKDGQKIHGKKILGLVDLGYIFLEHSTESWIFSVEGNELLKNAIKELETGKIN